MTQFPGVRNGASWWCRRTPVDQTCFRFIRNEIRRLEALRDLNVFGSPAEPQFDALCQTAQAMFGVPIALISVIGDREQRFKGRCGLDTPSTPREVSFCTYTILSDAVMVVEDATRDERFAANRLVTGDPAHPLLCRRAARAHPGHSPRRLVHHRPGPANVLGRATGAASELGADRRHVTPYEPSAARSSRERSPVPAAG